MTKVDLVINLHERHPEFSRALAGHAIDALLDVLKSRLGRRERVLITNFGSFEVLERRARRGRNPATGDIIRIQPRRTVVFRSARRLEDGLANFG